ncbi:MAG: PstS family phosphate ABC transporter substrate-binding protein [Methanolobus sp.]|uniref:PstS family phosphate ABC transporter substrate-binding protein n=1 Tax=Methanolobus sp. TaxID=1874737 RepID=UPI0027307EF8|nr:PstS family phosphate ABC transporter substrate-binding protein [Methanolobus sp.]MDP2215995.1 PstS family phosphate ABC transporter substrate-binding protein [Methanolobus sp.]
MSKEMLKRFSIGSMVLLLLAAVFTGIGCVGNDQNETGDAPTTGSSSITVKGSDTVLPLTQAEAEDFMIENPNMRVTVIGGGSGVGFAALIDGEVPIAMSSREIKESEIQKAQQRGINPVEHTIGWDGIAVVVNPDNPVSQLTYEQLQAIYDGNISNWKDVGGEDRAIAVITRDSSSGTYEYFKEEILVDREYRPDALAQPATGGIVQEVSRNKGAIGYIGFAYLDDSTQAVALDGGEGFVEATEENILSGEYPLSRPLYYYTNGEPQGAVKEFMDFVMSPTGQAIVSEVGYFPAVQ